MVEPMGENIRWARQYLERGDVTKKRWLLAMKLYGQTDCDIDYRLGRSGFLRWHGEGVAV